MSRPMFFFGVHDWGYCVQIMLPTSVKHTVHIITVLNYFWLVQHRSFILFFFTCAMEKTLFTYTEGHGVKRQKGSGSLVLLVYLDGVQLPAVPC